MVVIGHNASDVSFIYDLQDFVEFLEKHDISKEDLVGFIVEGLNKEVPWLADGIFGHDGFCVRGRADGIWGDDWYEYLREVRELADEVDVTAPAVVPGPVHELRVALPVVQVKGVCDAGLAQIVHGRPYEIADDVGVFLHQVPVL